MSGVMQLDHIVINAQQEMDNAEAVFTELGFSLTPRGYHTLGSINALAMFGSDYLELLGFPAGGEVKRPELASAPKGLNGLVFKSSNVDDTFTHLQKLGVAGDPPKSFSRPVTLANGETHDAKFRTVALRADAFPAGRFYFCEHLTPELVWRTEWQGHANATARFDEMVVVAEDAAETADLIANVIHSTAVAGTNAVQIDGADDFRLVVHTPAQYQGRFGPAARPMAGRTAMFGAISLRGRLPEDVVANVGSDAATYTMTQVDGRTCILVNDFDAVLMFGG